MFMRFGLGITLWKFGLSLVGVATLYWRASVDLQYMLLVSLSILVPPGIKYLHKKPMTQFQFRKGTALFWVVTQRVVAIYCRRFKSNYRSNLQDLTN
jgi:hypothetical protein